MNKVYTYPQKIFKSLAALAVIFGVTSCATSQSTAASSGETDGIYYSPSKDGQVQYVSNETPQDYEIKVGGAYFDANGNGAEEFYYEGGAAEEAQNVNVYTGSNNIYVASGTSDWGRYDGVDITVNNWGWNDPWMGGWGYGYGFNNWGWGMGWNSWGMGMGWNWGYPRWGWHNPYWGGGWGYNNWGWGGYPYYGGFYGGYYGGYYGNGYYGNGHYYRNRVRSGVRPGSNLAYSPFNDRGGNVRRGNSFAQGNQGVRPTRNGNVRMDNNSGVRSSQSNVRPIRTEQPVRNNNNISSESGVRPTRTEGNVRPVRATVPNEVRQNNTPVRTNNNPVRTNNNQIRTNEPNRNVSPQRNNEQPVRSNQGIQSSPNRGSSNSGGIRSGGGSPSRGSGGGGGVRSGGGGRR